MGMRVRRLGTSLTMVAVLAVATLASSSCAVVETPRPTWNNGKVDVRAEIVIATWIRDARAFWGQHQITLHGTLTDKGRAWSDWMSVGGCGGASICHSQLSQGINGRVPSWSLLGENVGVGGDLQSLWNAFMNSPGHRANVLDPRWNFAGIGVIRSGHRYYVTMEFMRA